MTLRTSVPCDRHGHNWKRQAHVLSLSTGPPTKHMRFFGTSFLGEPVLLPSSSSPSPDPVSPQEPCLSLSLLPSPSLPLCSVTEGATLSRLQARAAGGLGPLPTPTLHSPGSLSQTAPFLAVPSKIPLPLLQRRCLCPGCLTVHRLAMLTALTPATTGPCPCHHSPSAPSTDKNNKELRSQIPSFPLAPSHFLKNCSSPFSACG